jgi:acyl carrier protein phosphodiesterase
VNHLAHALLSGDDDDRIAGSMMGDFLHGAIPATLPARVAQGIRLHRAVDVYTDSHPEVAALRARFAAPFRRYAGILLDVWFDHLLARDFARYAAEPLEPYAARFRALLDARRALFPPALQAFVGFMHRHRLPQAYAEATTIARVLAGIGTRLRRANPLADAMPALLADADALERGFRSFFPQLQAFAASHPIRVALQ